MNDKEFIQRIAELWIELGGDAEGVNWVWTDLRDEIDRQLRDDDTCIICGAPAKYIVKNTKRCELHKRNEHANVD